MVIEKSVQDASPMIKHYWPRYYHKAVVATILMQLLISILVGGALIIMGVTPGMISFWIIFASTLIVTIFLNLLLIAQLLTPLKDLSAALTHVSDEPNAVTPPNPNAKHFERDGFKPLLQYIYQTAANAPSKTTTPGEGVALPMLEKTLNQTAAGVVVLNSKGEIVFSNQHAPITSDNTGTKHLSLLFEKDDSFTDWLARCHTSAVHAEKTWLRVPDKITGEEGRRIFDITANYEKGSSAEVVLVMHDRTSLYQPEDDDLDFIAFAAHELRGPITVIRGYLDVLTQEVSPTLQPDQQELIKRLIVSANRLSGYVNNILNASKFDRRHLHINLTEASLADIYDMINDDMQLRAQSQNRLLAVNIPRDLPTIAADRSSLSEVIGNLIDNALKYSNEGGAVNVTAGVEGNFVKLSVEDHGIGMPATVVSNLFHKFYRSHRSRETVAGTGIGLYISKAMIESHGGQISVRSAEGEGSTFTITIPIYSTVADKLKMNNNSNDGLIRSNSGWIKNHAMYKG